MTTLNVIFLFDDGEGFKSSLRWNINGAKNDERITLEVLEAIAGFLNTGDSVLLIGVRDDGFASWDRIGRQDLPSTLPGKISCCRFESESSQASGVLSEFIRARIQRQVQRECRPACRRTLNSDCSAVGFRTTAYQREPQARADLLSRLSPPRSRKWIKEVGLIFASDYRSIIVSSSAIA